MTVAVVQDAWIKVILELFSCFTVNLKMQKIRLYTNYHTAITTLTTSSTTITTTAAASAAAEASSTYAYACWAQLL